MDIANLETQKIATSTINYSLRNTIKNIDMDELIEFEKDDDGSISSVGFDSNTYNNVVFESVSNAQHFLKLMEEGRLDEIDVLDVSKDDRYDESGIIYTIPLGAVTKNAFFAQLGPKIPVRFTAIGDVDVDLNESIERVGINNTWIRVSLDLEVQVEIIIPYQTKMEKVTTTIPVGLLFVPGEVPQFYGEGQENSVIPGIMLEK